MPQSTGSEVSTSLNLAETSGAGANVLFESSHDWEAKVTLSDGYQLTVLEGAGTYIQNLWRPTEDSMMNSNTSGFNAISRETIYKRVMQRAYGSPWEYDYEEFVKFDQGTVQKLPRFHRPVFVNQRID